jgi:predicted metal-dependent enzyme (double-stranded beta helix superfamily)
MSGIFDIFKALKSVITLADDVQRQQTELKEIRRDLRDLTIIVHALAQDIHNSKEHAEQRHKNLLLELENRLLKFENRLPGEVERPSRNTAKKGGKKS